MGKITNYLRMSILFGGISPIGDMQSLASIMGRVKEQELLRFERGYSYPDKDVCRDHFEDYAILQHIEEYSEGGTCSYCGEEFEESGIIPMEFLIEFISKGIFSFYGDPNDEGVSYDSSEGGWLLDVYDSYALFHDEIYLEVDNQELQDDLIDSFSDNQWCIKDPYVLEEHQELSFDWRHFSNIVKHKIRYSFFRTSAFDGEEGKELSQILVDIARGVDTLNLITELKQNSMIYRCRQHKSTEKVDSFEKLTSPPDKYAIQPNRMCPAGISMFYGAMDKRTAELEVVKKDEIKNQDCVTMGGFKVIKPLQIVDFTVVKELPSIFDSKERKNYYLILFFLTFSKEIAKEIIHDGRQHIEYIPTQILTEYFRYVFEELSHIHIDGIKYYSAKSPNEKCLVLFLDNKESKGYLELIDFQLNQL